MTGKTQAIFVQLVNRNTSRILFSAATDELSKEAFKTIWNAVGETVYKGVEKASQQANYYELRIDPILGGES